MEAEEEFVQTEVEVDAKPSKAKVKVRIGELNMKKTRIPNETYRFYKAMYPELPESYVRKVLRKIKSKFGRLDAITVNYYMTTSLGKMI